MLNSSNLIQPVQLVDGGIQLILPCGKGLGCLHPHIIYNSLDEKPYWLYYTPYPPDEAELPYLARSSDGLNFDCVGIRNPLINRGEEGSWDDHHLADIDVLQVGNRWFMYYSGASYRSGVKRVAVGLATSTNGIKWEKLEEPVLIPDERYWWERGTRHYKGVLCPTVIYLKGKFYMYYESIDSHGLSHIALAESTNGVDFERVGVVLSPKLPWERLGVNHPFIVKYDDKLIMLYVGFDEEHFRLGVAIGNVEDPLHFTRYKRPLLPGREHPISKLLRRLPLLQKVTSLSIRLIVSKMVRRFTQYSIPSPFWNTWYAYRSSLLSTPSRELVLDKENTTLLYVSVYDSISLIPSIGVYRVRVELE